MRKENINEKSETIQWNGKNEKEIKKFAGKSAVFLRGNRVFKLPLRIITKDGTVHVDIGDYIVKDENGDFCVQKSDMEDDKGAVI